MADPAELAMIEQAFAAGYQADQDRQGWMRDHPGEGIAIGWTPEPDAFGRQPRGLGYELPPADIPVFSGPEPGRVPRPVPTPVAFDASAPPSLTGSTHSWGYDAGYAGTEPAGRGSPVAYLGLGEDASPPRRNLFSRLLRRR